MINQDNPTLISQLDYSVPEDYRFIAYLMLVWLEVIRQQHFAEGMIPIAKSTFVDSNARRVRLTPISERVTI
jgi:hypothetical protein